MLDVNRINTNIKRILSFSVIAFLVVALWILIAPGISAQAEETLEVVEPSQVSETETEEDFETDVTYRFIAEQCDSLTKLVRRAILTYDSANDEIELSQEGVVYAETNIVQDMGARWLEIGEVVEVNGSSVEQYASSSLELTPEQIAAWSKYVPLVDFDIIDIQEPADKDEVVKTIKDEVNGELYGPEVTVAEDDSNDGVGWWFAGVGSAAAVWYLLWKREEQ